MGRTRLEVLICTCGENGLDRVADIDLPKVEGVSYLVSWQPMSRKVGIRRPVALDREDVAVYVSPTTGLSNNRNAALTHATGEICLVADDDLSYTPEGLMSVIDAFDSNPAIDVAAFMYDSDADRKAYPAVEWNLSERLPKYWFLTSFELAFRRESIGYIRWSPLMGIGAPVLAAGEEELLLWQMRRNGLKCRFFPRVVAFHPGATTGYRRMSEPSVLMSKGALWRITHPFTAPLRILLNAWREKRSGHMGLWHAIKHAARGYAYGMRYFDSKGNPRRPTT
ncbi:MAG: glycosyltransferase [Pseudoflavonifractor sp.]|nr:glycosyltransferase [Pseudoflavonifractor sp.]